MKLRREKNTENAESTPRIKLFAELFCITGN